MIRLFRVFVPTGTLTMLLSELLWVTAAFVLATFVVLPTDPTLFLLYDNGLVRILLVVVSAIVTLHFHDLYTNLYVTSRVTLLQQLCMVAGVILLLQGLISYVNPSLRVPIRVMLPGTAAAILIIFAWRIVFSAYVLQVVGREKVLLVGATPLLEEIARYLEENPGKGSQVTGYVTDESPVGTRLAGGTILGSPAALQDVVEATQPNRIIVGVPENANSLPVAELLELRYGGQPVEEAASAYERVAGRVCLKALRPEQLLYLGEYGPSRENVFHQTVIDRTVAFLGILVLLPILLVAALAVRLSSAGPVLNRRTRIGLKGNPFTLYKFRCLRGAAGEADIWTAKDDPRVTKVGRVLRTTRVDELPQLFNVLRGDMAIVGPRAERPEFVKRLGELIPCYPQRQQVRPGITGWAQMNQEEGVVQDAITRLEYDLYYIKNMSFSLDTFILLHSLKEVVLSRGAD